MIRRPPRSTLSSSSAASDVYKRQHTLSTTMNWVRLRRSGQVPRLAGFAPVGADGRDSAARSHRARSQADSPPRESISVSSTWEGFLQRLRSHVSPFASLRIQIPGTGAESCERKANGEERRAKSEKRTANCGPACYPPPTHVCQDKCLGRATAADSAELPQLHRSKRAVRGPAADPEGIRPQRPAGRLFDLRLFCLLHDCRTADRSAGRSLSAPPDHGDRRLPLEPGDAADRSHEPVSYTHLRAH